MQFGRLRRREFITLIGGAAAWPLAARARVEGKLPTIGILGPTTASAMAPWISAFLQRLRELGWIEGRTVLIEYRWAEARTERFAQIAAEFIKLKVDVIVTYASAPVLAAKHSTTLIPIVFAAQMDPVGAGVVASLAHPGGNVTGLSLQTTDSADKRLELLREVVSNLGSLAIIANPGAAGAQLEMREVERAARKLGLKVTTLETIRLNHSICSVRGRSASQCRLRSFPAPMRLLNSWRCPLLADSVEKVRLAVVSA